MENTLTMVRTGPGDIAAYRRRLFLTRRRAAAAGHVLTRRRGQYLRVRLRPHYLSMVATVGVSEGGQEAGSANARGTDCNTRTSEVGGASSTHPRRVHPGSAHSVALPAPLTFARCSACCRLQHAWTRPEALCRPPLVQPSSAYSTKGETPSSCFPFQLGSVSQPARTVDSATVGVNAHRAGAPRHGTHVSLCHCISRRGWRR